MLRPYQFLLPLLSLFLSRVDLTDVFPLRYEVDLVRIMDGDTYRVKLGGQEVKVRMAKIDAPEKAQYFQNAEGNAGKASIECAKKFLRPKFVLTIYQFDMYGRILGDLDDLNYRLIREGCAALYPYARFESIAEKFHFLRAQALARQERKGLWNLGAYQLPKNWRKKHPLRRQTAHPP